MSRPAPRAFALACLAFGLLVWTGTPGRADRLHLEGGGTLETPHWWIEGDTLFYETDGGTVGIPRGRIVRIEKTAPSPATDGSATSDASTRGTDEAVRDETRAGTRTRTGPSPRRTNARARDRYRAGLEDLDAYRFESAARAFKDALEADPDLVDARVGYVVAQIRAGHDGLALSVLYEGLSRHPEDARLHELLGDLRNREERIEDAWRQWTTAHRLAPSEALAGKIERARRELDARGGFAFATTPHFNVRYDDGKDSPLAHEAIDALEEAWWAVTDRFDHQPLQPINVLVYSERQFRSLTQAPAEVAGLFDGKIRVPLGGLERLTRDARRVLTHELAHAVLHSKTRGNCPRWLHEGLAQQADGSRLTAEGRAELARTLDASDPDTLLTEAFSYPAALSFCDWLVETYGRRDLLRLLDDLSDGRPWKDVVESGWGVDWARMLDEWARTVREGSQR